MIDEIEVGKKYRLIDKEGYMSSKYNGNYNRRLLATVGVFDADMCVVITTEREGCGSTAEMYSVISPNEYHLFELVDEDDEQEHVQTELKNKKLIDILIEYDIKWPEGADGVVQDCDGEVKFYTGEKLRMLNGVWMRDRDNDYADLHLQIASDYNTAVITKTDWENRKVDKKPMFADIKIGDKVWDICRGWGVNTALMVSDTYPIEVEFEHGYGTYTRDGYNDLEDVNPSLFWNEIKIEAPPKPLPDLEVDAKVLVWSDPRVKQKRHFSHFSEDGRICVFESGRTSYTRIYRSTSTAWPNWELAE